MTMKALVGMSGGVDSSVAAYLLKRQGFEVTGVTMCLGISTEDGAGVKCCGPQGIADARAVCDRLGIRHVVLDHAAEFRRHVVDPFIAAYRAATTPNPCVWCNEFLKFGSLARKAKALGFDCIATGHYARITDVEGRLMLGRPRDRAKDQTYFLYRIPPSTLGFIRFPLADMTKTETRALAEEARLPVARKRESQDICFTFDNDYRALVAAAGPGPSGVIVDVDGRRMAGHNGIHNFTVGQRRGLGFAAGRRLHVIDIDQATGTVTVGEKPDLAAAALTVKEPNLFVEALPARALVQIRYQHEAAPAALAPCEDGIRVGFDEPQFAVTPGQSAVFYDAEGRVLGGGYIEREGKLTGPTGFSASR